jgi:hypothetical protein
VTLRESFLALVVLYFKLRSCQKLLIPRYNLASIQSVRNVCIPSQLIKETLCTEIPIRLAGADLRTEEDQDCNL